MVKKISLSIDEEKDRRIEELMGKTGARTKAELFSYAIALYDWAISEAEEGKSIASVDRDAREIKELEMPPLRNIRRRSSEGEG